MDDLNQNLFDNLPDPEAARRFISQFQQRSPRGFSRLSKNPGLMSDVVTLASYSPLLAVTIQQNPEYLSWLEKERTKKVVATKDELLESLARFSLTHSDLDIHVLLARFRRRELLRIFLRDIRRLATIAEITEEISDLADAILEYALREARRDLDNLYGIPLETDDKARSRPSEFCVVSLGKLGSKELNYASDIDLLFIYSADGTTSGQGERGAISNREYFTKLSQKLIRIVGEQSGEGAAYRVDLRLRPHGSIGPLAQSLADTVRYYTTEARRWEMQVLIRSRSSAGEAHIYSDFFHQVEDLVFSKDLSPESAIAQVHAAKQRIDVENREQRGTNVKLGPGGIREIEFIAQGLQLAHGGVDRWLRAPHTLISLSRVADRGYISESELTQASNAYDFLRRLEHVLQMENGLQTHTVSRDPKHRELVAARMNCADLRSFDKQLSTHTKNVNRIFKRIFGTAALVQIDVPNDDRPPTVESQKVDPSPVDKSVELIQNTSPRFASLIVANVDLTQESNTGNYHQTFHDAISTAADFGSKLSALRRAWSPLHLRIAADEILGRIDMFEAKRRQTELAEASLEAAIEITRSEIESRKLSKITSLPFAILALGKLGGGAVDYDSDLDVVFVYDEGANLLTTTTASEFFSRAAEILVNTLSGMTRDGSLYRIDLRLRPYGKNGPLAISDAAFADYLNDKADIWELLAFVKLRAVAGDLDLGKHIEHTLRDVIHRRALTIDTNELRSESLRIRNMLEAQRAGKRKDVDIKYGAGGMLDVYFVARYLQLRDNVPDAPGKRSTSDVLQALKDNGSLSDERFTALVDGYHFLSSLDHNIRLTIGRSTRIPQANLPVMQIIAGRMQLKPAGLMETLTTHRLQIRWAFEQILEG